MTKEQVAEAMAGKRWQTRPDSFGTYALTRVGYEKPSFTSLDEVVDAKHHATLAELVTIQYEVLAAFKAYTELETLETWILAEEAMDKCLALMPPDTKETP